MLLRPKDRKRGHFSRIIFLGTLFFILWILIILRLAQLQIIDYKKYTNIAKDQRIFEKEEDAERGKIFVEENKQKIPVAFNIYSYTLYAVPQNISNPEETAVKIAQSLEIPINSESNEFKDILDRISKKNDWYEILKKDLSQVEVDRIKKYSIEGIDFEEETKRFYPEENYFSHILGFCGYNENGREGRYGLEEYYDNILSGKGGMVVGEKTPGEIVIPTGENVIKEAKMGSDIILTIDRTIQTKTCEILEEAVKEYEASRGTIIVVEPKTGGILALCNWPNFNPNEYSKVKNINVYSNDAESFQYEPGSIFKVITFAAGLEDGKITPETPFEDKGAVKIGGYTIKNAGEKTYGKTTMRGVLEKSINTGAVFVAKEVGLDRFNYWVKNFGFGQKTEIDLPGEINGDLSNLGKKSEIYLATASFGQGIAVTPIQMVMSFAAIANGGKLMKPYLVKEIISGERSFKNDPEETRQVISLSTAETLKDLMISAVENGWGKRAAVKGYLVAGKTGTAEIPKGGGYSENSVHSFIGFAPADKPKFVALVKLDNPALVKFSDQTATPTFGKLADFLLKYYQIPPTEIE